MATEAAGGPSEAPSVNLHAATNLVRRPVDGAVLTSSGRSIPAPPWILPEEPETADAYDRWLVKHSRDEAIELGDELILARIASLDGPVLAPMTRQMLSDFLFGLLEPEFEARKGPD